jgi:hypothetical protein
MMIGIRFRGRRLPGGEFRNGIQMRVTARTESTERNMTAPEKHREALVDQDVGAVPPAAKVLPAVATTLHE